MSDLIELFSRDPLQHTDDDIQEIIEGYRKSRHQFVGGDKSAGNVKRVPKLDPELEALGIEIKL